MAIPDFKFNFENEPIQFVKLNSVVKSPKVPASIKEIARKILAIEGGHYLIGDWLQEASWVDINTVRYLVDLFFSKGDVSIPSKEEEELACGMALLAVMVFCAGEGLIQNFEDGDSAVKKLQLLKAYISAESLKRTGIPVKVYYENMTLDETSPDKPIIEMLGEGI